MTAPQDPFDAAAAENVRLNRVALDLQKRCEMERGRADAAQAALAEMTEERDAALARLDQVGVL